MKNKALLVGINKYPDPRNELRGCINDILDMEHLIAETNKVYAKQNIKKLTDRQATKKEIVSQIKWLVEGAEPGDQLLFHYSGHGAQVPTLSPKLEADGLDLCKGFTKLYKTPMRHTILGPYMKHYKAKHSKADFSSDD